jgi:hypothetical protein
MINSKVKEAENAVVDVRSRASRRGGNFAKDIGKGRKRAGKSEVYMASEPVDDGRKWVQVGQLEAAMIASIRTPG